MKVIIRYIFALIRNIFFDSLIYYGPSNQSNPATINIDHNIVCISGHAAGPTYENLNLLTSWDKPLIDILGVVGY